MRARLAPSAARIAISCARAAERTSIRLATFTTAISSTRVTAASIASSAKRTSPTINSLTGRMLKLKFLPSKLDFIMRVSARACSGPTPRFKRATPVRKYGPRRVGGCNSSAVHNCTFLPGKSRAGDITPMMVKPTPFKLIVRPTACGSAAKYLCQKPSLSTVRRRVPARSSSGRKVRPSRAGVPSRGKKLAVTLAAWIRSLDLPSV